MNFEQRFIKSIDNYVYIIAIYGFKKKKKAFFKNYYYLATHW